ncbi:MAG: AMP-binding protein [Actinophytocola sp.]|uniref:condensation domain-containing protein n=1 Tax=Actinophytocola sp. TaxID=1872138 RepID=UPI00132B8AD4|nr:condensation domain-containing protein [Actinophytocola sp.]MPZ81613.1 AMP-binding protein [Actinophytocola sp.]
MNEVLSYRASHAQQQMWFVEQLVPGEPVHNISLERRHAGLLDPAALRAAVADLVGRHESLRTRFEVRDNTLWQVVQAPPDQPPVEFCELSGAADPEAAYRDLCARVGTRVFDLGRAPLLRMVHARLGPATDALVVVLHHAIADATSAGILIRDLTTAYERRLAGRAPDWPELPVQYADFTAWQEDRAAGPAVRQDLDYWRGQLAELSTLDLAYGKPRPGRLTQRGRRLSFAIEAGVVSALDEFVRAERATAFMGLLAAYAATLGRVFGGEDVAVASTVLGRPLPVLGDVIGMFVDQVVLRLDLSGGPTFRELVRAARRVVGEAHDHGSATFDQIVAAVAPERVAGMTPLAQAAINLQPPVRPRPSAGGMPRTTGSSQIDTGTVTHDLLLDLVPDPAPYAGTVRYRPDVVDDAAAELVCEMFPRLLRAALAEPDRPMWTFQGLWPDEDAGPVATPDGLLLHELIEQQVAGTPHAPAVVWAGGSLDFADLAAAANRVAHALRARGAHPEEPVLVALPRSAELAVAFLGVLKAGGVCVPVDPATPAAQLAALAGRCGAGLALTLPDARVALPGSVEAVPVAIAAAPDPGPLSVPVRPDNGAYVMFGSGPAGVLVTHRNAVSAVGGLLTVLPAGSSHLPTGSSPTALLCALAGGGALHVADDAPPADFLHTTPAHLTALLAGGDPAAVRPRRAVVLGEPADPALRARLDGAGWDVVVLYGPAETGTVAAGPLDLATPLPGVRADVLDRWGQPVPPGCRGELYVGGPQVARGCPGAPGATAAAFVPDPGSPGARRFRTGDLVRRLPDGRLEFCGRTDRQDVTPVPEPAGPPEREGPREPETPVEEALLDGWRWLLPKREFGVTDDFFDIGGDSILAIHAVAEARRHGLTLTVRQILDLRTVRALARALDVRDPVRRPAPLGITGPTVLRLPAPVAEAPAIPGVTVAGRRLTADPSQVDDWSLGRIVRQLRPAGPAAPAASAADGVPGLLVPPETVAALDGPAHEAYATTTTDLVVAATLAATGEPAVAVADTRREEPAATGGHAVPGLARVGTVAGEVDLIRAVKAALRTPEEDDPAVPGVRVLLPPADIPVTAVGDAGTRLLVTLAGARLIVTGEGGDGLAERVRDQLVRLVEHCVAAEPAYSAADFPDAGLDDAAMAGLLASLDGVGSAVDAAVDSAVDSAVDAEAAP